jgi:hypothetical protein
MMGSKFTLYFEWPIGGGDGFGNPQPLYPSNLEGAQFAAALLFVKASDLPAPPSAYRITDETGRVVSRYPERT